SQGIRQLCTMPRPRGNLSITMRRRRPTGPPQLKRFIRQRSTVFLPMLFMTLAGCRPQKLRPRPRPRSTPLALLLRKQKAAQQLSRVLFLTAFLLQTSKQKHRKAANPLLLWAQWRTRRLLGRKSRVWEQRLNNLLFPSRMRRLRRHQVVSHTKDLRPGFRDRLLV